jgi:hypothetical protein
MQSQKNLTKSYRGYTLRRSPLAIDPIISERSNNYFGDNALPPLFIPQFSIQVLNDNAKDKLNKFSFNVFKFIHLNIFTTTYMGEEGTQPTKVALTHFMNTGTVNIAAKALYMEI